MKNWKDWDDTDFDVMDDFTSGDKAAASVVALADKWYLLGFKKGFEQGGASSKLDYYFFVPLLCFMLGAFCGYSYALFY